jgi:4-amino-4-deoxy-L-arabinose transferase-like glycosyltransferase
MTIEPGFKRSLAILCAIGVCIRLLFLLAAGALEFQSDEANYVYLAISWNHFGFYSDSFRYFWPPGYPFLLALCLDGFEMAGIFVLKLIQVLGSASIGLTTMLIALRLFGPRAAKAAGILWCVYLPLIGFTHYLWAETLFMAFLMPSLYLVLALLQERARAHDRALILAGLLFGAALYFKEVVLYLAPLVALLIVWSDSELSWLEKFRRATLFLLPIVVLLMPWTLRNAEVYGRFVPVGTSLGENVFYGFNANYMNFDLVPFARQRAAEESPEIPSREWFKGTDAAGQWLRATEIPNTPDRLRENFRRGTRYAVSNPAWLVRSRIKKMADLVAPGSFFVRHQALGRYEASVLGAGGVRPMLVSWAVLCPVAILLLSIPGFFVVLRDRAGLWLIGTLALYFATTAMIVAMSRFRIPFVPWMIVLAAGFLTADGGRRRGTGTRWAISAACTAILLFLWWVDLPEVRAIVGLAWGAAS